MSKVNIIRELREQIEQQFHYHYRLITMRWDNDYLIVNLKSPVVDKNLIQQFLNNHPILTNIKYIIQCRSLRHG